SGISNDMRHILEEADKGNLQCKYAFEVFSYRVKKYISAYLGVLNGVDGIVFTAGIGENSYRVREKAISGLENLGVKLDPERNREAIGKEMEISTPDSRVKVWVIPTNEELVIARDTVKVLSKQ
ncbi:MAG: acetate kinase, partial [Candidatus Neomarinimicrobiota bacterium]